MSDHTATPSHEHEDPDNHDAHGHDEHDSGEGHGAHNSPDSEGVEKKASPLPVVLLIIAIIIFVLSRWCSACNEAKHVEAVQKAETRVAEEPKQLGQFTDRHTPATLVATSITDIYTDGEPIWVLPPGWPEKDKVYYSGKGRLNLDGDNIHAGTEKQPWRFWAAGDDPSKGVFMDKAVLIRAWGK